MIRKFWKDRPSTPVILAWMTAGWLAATLLGVAAYGVVRLIAFLVS